MQVLRPTHPTTHKPYYTARHWNPTNYREMRYRCEDGERYVLFGTRIVETNIPEVRNVLQGELHARPISRSLGMGGTRESIVFEIDGIRVMARAEPKGVIITAESKKTANEDEFNKSREEHNDVFEKAILHIRYHQLTEQEKSEIAAEVAAHAALVTPKYRKITVPLNKVYVYLGRNNIPSGLALGKVRRRFTQRELDFIKERNAPPYSWTSTQIGNALNPRASKGVVERHLADLGLESNELTYQTRVPLATIDTILAEKRKRTPLKEIEKLTGLSGVSITPLYRTVVARGSMDSLLRKYGQNWLERYLRGPEDEQSDKPETHQ